MRMIDTHCHLDADAFAQDLPTVIERARRMQVSGIVSVGVEPEGWIRQRDCRRMAMDAGMPTAMAVGLHPWWIEQLEPEAVLAELAVWLASPEDRGLPRQALVAVGEIGLDFAADMPAADLQKSLFAAQLELAEQHELPVILHARKSEDRLLWYLRRRPGLRGVVHGFTGSAQQAEQFIDQGFFIGVGGALTHPGATRMRRMLAELPASALVLETDAPNQPGHDHRGERNEPAWIGENLAALAAARDTDRETLAERLYANSLALFGASWLDAGH